jgi:hypothetical protein
MMKTTTVCAAVFAAVGSCLAGPVTFDWEGVARGKNARIDVDGFSGRVFAGSIKHRIDGELMLTYCIDPTQHAQKKVANFERTSLPSALNHHPWSGDRANALAELADNAGESIWQNSSNKNVSAAFQLATWEIVMDFDPTRGASSFDFGSGEFRASGSNSIFNLAETMLSDLSFSRGSAAGYDAYVHPDHQDFFGQAVPGPGVFALAMAGVPMLAGKRRRSA